MFTPQLANFSHLTAIGFTYTKFIEIERSVGIPVDFTQLITISDSVGCNKDKGRIWGGNLFGISETLKEGCGFSIDKFRIDEISESKPST